MILNHINSKMPIYKDCTLGEMLMVGSMNFVAQSVVLSLITKLCFGYAFIGFALAILLLVHSTRFLLGRLQKLKYGKPYGYYRQLTLLRLQQWGWLTLPIITRTGKWSVRRRQ